MTIATTEQNANVADSVTVDPGKVLAYLGLSPSDPKSQAVVAVAQRYDLDPVLKHVIVIPRGGVYITRDGLLHVAHRSGRLDGIVVDQEPTLSSDGKEWVARVSVYRKDMGHPFTFPGRYPVNGGNKEYAQEMALKAAEAHALRRAFDVTGIPAIEEYRPEATPQAGGGLASVLDKEADPEPLAPEDPEPVNESPLLNVRSGLAKRMFAVLNDAGLGGTSDEDKAARLAEVSAIIGRTIGSSEEMTEADAEAVINTLEVRADVTEGELVEEGDQ